MFVILLLVCLVPSIYASGGEGDCNGLRTQQLCIKGCNCVWCEYPGNNGTEAQCIKTPWICPSEGQVHRCKANTLMIVWIVICSVVGLIILSGGIFLVYKWFRQDKEMKIEMSSMKF